MALPQRTTLGDREEMVRAQVPGWDAWVILTHGRSFSWSARPDGASAAVISDMPSGELLVTAVRKYERELPRHLEDARLRLAGLPQSNIGRDQAAVLRALVTSLETMQARLAKAGGEA